MLPETNETIGLRESARGEIQALLLKLETFGSSADRRIEIRNQINQIGLEINAVYERAKASKPVPERAEIDKKVAPFQKQINRLRQEGQMLDADAHQLEQAAYDALRQLVSHSVAVSPTLDQFHQVWSLRKDPVEHLLKLKFLLVQALRAATGEPAHDSTVRSSEAAAGAPKGLKKHQRRMATYDQFCSELAAIRDAVRRHTTVPALKKRFPDFRIWKVLSQEEQRSLLEEHFTPKAYATTLTLREEGLTSPGSIKYSKKKVRDQSERTKQ